MQNLQLDINDYLKQTTFNIDNVYYNNIKVLDMNKTQLLNVCKNFNFSSFLTSDKSQVKLSKNKKELNINTIGISILPFSKLDNNYSIDNYSNSIQEYILNKYKMNSLTDYKIIFDFCTNSTSDCRKNCISETGNPMFKNAKQKAQLNRKLMFLKNTELFIAVYIAYLNYAIKNCMNKKELLSNRYNILSDIIIENINLIYNNKKINLAKLIHNKIIETNIFNIDNIPLKPYDYTKHYNRKELEYYKLVYSLSGFDNDKSLQAINNGLSVAMVYYNENKKPLPKTVKINNIELKTVNGDLNDYLPLHKKQVCVLLEYKYNRSDKKEIRQRKLNKAILNGFVRVI